MQTLPVLAKLYCSEEFTQGLDKQIISFSVINTVLAIASIVGNTVILMALHKGTTLHRPSKTLLRNLVASDLCVGFAELGLVIGFAFCKNSGEFASSSFMLLA